MVQKKHNNLKLPAQDMEEKEFTSKIMQEIDKLKKLYNIYLVEDIGVDECTANP